MKYKKIIILILVFLSIFMLFTLHGIYLHFVEWRSEDDRNHYIYNVQINGLEGTVTQGSTKIMVPMPADINGQFVSTPSQKTPSLSHYFVHKYIFHTPIEYQRGPYLKNTTESFENRIIGNWTSYIDKSEEGYMLTFQTNETVLENIYLYEVVVVDYIDALNPLEAPNPILYPASNFSNIEDISSDYQRRYRFEPIYKYDTFVHASDNLDKTELHFSVRLDVNEWTSEPCDSYYVYLQTNIHNSGKTKVSATLSQKK